MNKNLCLLGAFFLFALTACGSNVKKEPQLPPPSPRPGAVVKPPSYPTPFNVNRSEKAPYTRYLMTPESLEYRCPS